MADITWEYPILMVLAVAAGIAFYVYLTRDARPAKRAPERECARCKLKVVGQNAVEFRYCPFCGAKYEAL